MLLDPVMEMRALKFFEMMVAEVRCERDTLPGRSPLLCREKIPPFPLILISNHAETEKPHRWRGGAF